MESSLAIQRQSMAQLQAQQRQSSETTMELSQDIGDKEGEQQGAGGLRTGSPALLQHPCLPATRRPGHSGKPCALGLGWVGLGWAGLGVVGSVPERGLTSANVHILTRAHV